MKPIGVKWVEAGGEVVSVDGLSALLQTRGAGYQLRVGMASALGHQLAARVAPHAPLLSGSYRDRVFQALELLDTAEVDTFARQCVGRAVMLWRELRPNDSRIVSALEESDRIAACGRDVSVDSGVLRQVQDVRAELDDEIGRSEPSNTVRCFMEIANAVEHLLMMPGRHRTDFPSRLSTGAHAASFAINAASDYRAEVAWQTDLLCWILLFSWER